MNSLLFLLASGRAFFSGIVLIYLSAFLATRRTRRGIAVVGTVAARS